MQIWALILSISVVAQMAGCLNSDVGPGSESVAPGHDWPNPVYLRVDVENSAGRNATFRLLFNAGEPIEAAVPYTGFAPNVRKAFEGNVSFETLALSVTELHSGATLNRTFSLPQEQNWIIVNYYENGTLDARWLPHEPTYE